MTLPKDAVLPSVVIAGAGGLCYSLLRAMLGKGIIVKAVISRNPETAKDKIQLPEIPIVDYQAKGMEADLLILAVPDGKLEETARQVCSLNAIGCVVHCSGSASVQILQDIQPNYGVIYPLQTFTPGREVSFTDLPVFWESGSSHSEGLIQHFSEILSAKSCFLNSESRALLHTGAVFANNFNNFLALIATHFAEKAGQNPSIYQPILEETLSKLRVIAPDKAQTGPARRGDFETIERHLGILKAHFPEWQTLYQEFSDLIGKTEWK
jgi:predicted short-subunit dehydrogenase-like oxidoreductase (DUF2520 family)